ncbi:MAG: hypothetical protein ACSW8G_01265 [Bacillota bacterium]
MTKTMTTTSKHPDREQCLRFLKEYGTPDHVVAHCKAVADAACRIGRALNEAGGTKAADINDIKFLDYRKQLGHIGYAINCDTLENPDGFRPFDIELVEASGLLHDMARVKDNHWDEAADFCLEHGFEEEAKVIRVHMSYEFTVSANYLTEADLVCLGDRLVLEDRYMGIDQRMDYIIAKAERRGDTAAKPIILRKKEETKVLLRQIEDRIGMSLDELMAD